MMANVANNWGKGALMALGAAALAVPLYGAIAQEHDHSAHAHDGAGDVEPLTAEQIAASRQVFATYSCGACHVMADAGGNGHIGPALDGNDGLSVEYVTQIISNGQGAMPSFGGMVTEEEIDTLARYIVEAKAE
ncbi:MAG: c-type cytochrome [Erythrobacter sp.]|nr:MAG: c-type cytochrome [Erythrobacter sp.]